MSQEVVMGRSAVILLLLAALAIVGLLDRDGVLARTNVAARALGIELRVDVTVHKVARAPAVPAVPAVPAAPPPCPPTGTRPCE